VNSLLRHAKVNRDLFPCEAGVATASNGGGLLLLNRAPRAAHLLQRAPYAIGVRFISHGHHVNHLRRQL